MSIRCLPEIPKNTEAVKELNKSFPELPFNVLWTKVGSWMSNNLKDNEDRFPTVDELRSWIYPNTIVQWARTAENSYEVSTRGDRRFSALNARFKPGTIIDGVDVGGVPREMV